MVDKRDCTFCGETIEPGTGMLYIRKDGTRHEFCSSKCRRNMLDLKRIPRTVKWTKHYVKGGGKKSRMTASAAAATGTAEAPKPKAQPKPAKAKAKAEAPAPAAPAGPATQE
ncbi:MAG: 50S ribosomal protein L24e [Halobacteriales archaeon]|nr:50S ribosomal protein L24e [Halobacteriales archaeon]